GPAARTIIGVAEFVIADKFAMPARIEARVESSPIPPGEESEEEIFHRDPAWPEGAGERAGLSAVAAIWLASRRLSRDPSSLARKRRESANSRNGRASSLA